MRLRRKRDEPVIEAPSVEPPIPTFMPRRPLSAKRKMERWTAEEEQTLLRLADRNMSNYEIGKHLKRTDRAVEVRLNRLRHRGAAQPAAPCVPRKRTP